MSVELFFKLKEIDSLTKMRNNHLRAKSEQQNRLSKLNDRRQESVLQTAKLKQDMSSINNDLLEIESKIKTASEQKQRLMDIGADEKKISSFVKDLDDFEEKGLNLLGQIEEIERDLNDSKKFIDGIDKTIQEIGGEVKSEVVKIDAEMANIELRIDLLMDELPSDYKALLQKVSAKNLAHGPFTRVEQGSCYFCRYKISRMEESEIDMQKNLKTCSQCSRIFLPFGS